MILTKCFFAFTAVPQVALAALDDWMGGNVTKAGITGNLEAFKQAGIGMARSFSWEHRK